MVQQANASLKNYGSGHLETSTTSSSPLVGPWKCNVCEEEFRNPKAHVEHMISHAEEYPSSCKLCLSRFRNATDLGKHGRVCVASANRHKNTIIAPPPPEITHRSTNQEVEEEDDGEEDSVNLHIEENLQSPPFLEDGQEDLFDRFENAQNPVRSRSRSSSFETNNNLSDKGDDSSYLINDPWKACSTLITNSGGGHSRMRDLMLGIGEDEILPPVLEPMDDVMDLIHPAGKIQKSRGRRRNSNNSRERQNNFSWNKGSVDDSSNNKRRQRNLSSGSKSSSSTCTSGTDSHFIYSHPPASPVVSAPLLDLWNIVSNHEQELYPDPERDSYHDHETMRGGECDDNIGEDYSDRNVNRFPPRELVCNACKRNFSSVTHWENHLKLKHILAPKQFAFVKLQKLKVDNHFGPFVVCSDGGNVTFVPKYHQSEISESVVGGGGGGTGTGGSSSESDSGRGSTSSSSPVSVGVGTRTDQGNKEVFKFTFCRSKGSYVLKRKSTESLDSGDREKSAEGSTNETVVSENVASSPPPISSPPAPVQEEITEQEEQASVDESHKEVAAPPPQEEVPDQAALEAAIEQSRVNRAAAAASLSSAESMPKTSSTTISSGKDGGESSTEGATKVPVFQRRFVNVLKQRTGGPIQRRTLIVNKTNKYAESAIAPGPEKISASTPSLISDKPLPDLVSQPEVPPSSPSKEPPSPVQESVTIAPDIVAPGRDSNRGTIRSCSPSIEFIDDLGISKTKLSASKDSLPVKGEPEVEVSQTNQDSSSPVSPAQPPLPPEPDQTDNGNLNEADEGEGEQQEPDEDEGGLVIDVPEEAVRAIAEAEGALEERDEPQGVAEVEEDLQVRAQRSPGERGDQNNEEDENECPVCKKNFSTGEELHTHFKEHIRITSLSNIASAESPSQTVTVRGTSSIFENEDEVEESEPFPLRRESTEDYPTNLTLTSLLRRNSNEERNKAVEHNSAGGVSYSLPQGRGEGPNPYHPQYRPIQPGPRAPVMGSATNYMGQVRPGMRPMAPQQGQRAPYPYRPNGFPATLHQALVGPGPGPQPAYRAPPPRPQLRPMPGIHNVSGGRAPPPPHLQNRPHLQRAQAPGSTHPQSILLNNQTQNPQGIRQSPPLQTQSQQQQQQQPPPHLQQYREHNVQLQIQQKLQQIQQQLERLSNAYRQETELSRLTKMQNERDILLQRHAHLQTQLQQYGMIQQQRQQQSQHQQQLQNQQRGQQQQQQQQQQQLQRQQMHQLQLQQHQQQQLRQQQLQRAQAQQQQLSETVNHNNNQVNFNGKRPMESSFDHANHAKQPRLEGLVPSETSITEVNPSPSKEQMPLRLPNGVTLSVLQHSDAESATSPPSAHAQNEIGGLPQRLQPGGGGPGSIGSRHSSGTASPTLPSPVANRLAHSGITLTPASPAPLTPPQNPLHSPISDYSPRCSPITPVPCPSVTVIQRAPNSVSPRTVSPSVGPSPPQHPQPDPNFAVPRIPSRTSSGGSNVSVNQSAERPDRPPTIDLTDDEVLLHNSQMRATGGGVMTQEQAQIHQEMLAQRRGVSTIPGTGHFTIRPTITPPKPQACPHCNVLFPTGEAMVEHRQKVHGQGTQQSPPVASQPLYFRQPIGSGPQVAIRRTTPPTSMPNPSIQGPHPVPPPLRGVPRPPSHIQQGQIRPSQIHPQAQSRPQESVQRPGSGSSERDKFVIPLLNLSHLSSGKLQALNELGVASFIPLQGISSFGIPIMRLRHDTHIGHFPHDSVMEIGPVQGLVEQPSLGPPRSAPTTPPTNVVSPVPPPHVVHRGPCGPGTCADPTCPESMMIRRRPSPIGGGTAIQHHHPVPPSAPLAHSQQHIVRNPNALAAAQAAAAHSNQQMVHQQSIHNHGHQGQHPHPRNQLIVTTHYPRN